MHINLRQFFLASTIAALSGLTAGAAWAAPGDPVVPTASGLPSSKPAHMMSGAPDAKTMLQRVEKRIGEMHAALHITAAQQPQWDAFAKVMRDNAQGMDAIAITDVNTLATMTAVDQMQSYSKIAAQHAKDVQSLLPVFQTLYDSMSPDQKLNADKYFRADVNRARHGKKG